MATDVEIRFKVSGTDDVKSKLDDLSQSAGKAASDIAKELGKPATDLDKQFKDSLDNINKNIEQSASEAKSQLAEMSRQARARIDEMTKPTSGGDGLKTLAEKAKESSEVAQAATINYAEMGAAIGRVGAIAAGAAIAVASFTVKMARTGLKEADNMRQLAERTGLTTEALSKLKYQAELLDVPFSALASAASGLDKDLTNMTSKIGKVNKKFADSLGQLGLDPNKLKAMNTEQRFEAIAEALRKIDDASKRSALVQNLFGGTSLKPYFDTSVESLREMNEELEQFGGVISSKTGKDADQFFDNFTKLGTALSGIRTQVTAGLSDDLRKLSDALVFLVKSNGPGIQGLVNALSMLGKGLLFVAKVIGSVVIAVSAVLGDIGKIIGGLAAMNDALLHFEFKEAGRIVKEMLSDIAKSSKDTEKALKDLWGAVEEAPAVAKKMSYGVDQMQGSLQRVAMGGGWTGPGSTGTSKVDGVPDREDWNDLMSDMRSFSRSFSSETARMLVEGEKSWSDYFKRIEQLIAEIIINQTIARPLEAGVNALLTQAFAGAFGGSSGAASPAPAPAPSDFGPYLQTAATGGRLNPGRMALVGEDGPELLAAGPGGRTVFPNGGGGGMVVNISQTFTGGVTHADMAAMIPQIQAQTIAAISQMQRRGGRL